MMKRVLHRSPPPIYTYLWDTWTLQSDQIDVEVDWERVVTEVRRKPRLARYHDEERRGMLLLHLACALYPTPEAVEVLIGANAAATSHVSGTGLIPLHIAAGRNASTETLRVLLRHDAKTIHVQDHNGQTAIHYACRQDVDKEVVHLLLQVNPTIAGGGHSLSASTTSGMSRPSSQSASRNRDIPSPLDILYKESGPAARDGYGRWTTNQWLKINKLVLVAHYGTLAARNGQTRSFLHAAFARNCPPEVLAIAIRVHGEQSAGVTDVFGNLPLHYAVGCSSLRANTDADVERANEILLTLLNFFPQAAGIRDAKGRLPLHQALKVHGSIDVQTMAPNGMLHELLRLYPLAVQVRDKETKLLPALLAAVHDVDTAVATTVEATYLLLREYPQIIPTANS